MDSYDNKYLTQELYDLDERKQILERPTILPLSGMEKNIFIEVRIPCEDTTEIFQKRFLNVLF